jgi:hypothetical protein
MLLAAKVWTYWLSWALIVPAVIISIALGIGYLVKVQSRKAPR